MKASPMETLLIVGATTLALFAVWAIAKRSADRFDEALARALSGFEDFEAPAGLIVMVEPDYGTRH